ncbi:MAG TPA: DUF1573 domain-containing protein [Lentimicrobium sp.]|nr:DUF1573 domain-containing protein [Lentimicrobium sp.]
MKRLTHFSFILVFLLTFTFSSCNQTNREKEGLPSDIVKNPNSASGNIENDLPVLEFEKDFYDFGKIIQGEKVSYSFKFENKGKSDLIISKVTTSCGCTVGDYPRTPIKPGASGNVEVKFDSENRRGFQNKTITVLSNAQPSTNLLRIKAQVVLPEEIN